MYDHIQSQMLQHLQLIRYLLSNADSRGLTHGEKHHLIEVALMEIGKCLRLAKDPAIDSISHHNVPEVTAIDTIPF